MQNEGDVNANDQSLDSISPLSVTDSPRESISTTSIQKEKQYNMRSFFFSVLLVLVLAVLFRMFVAAPYLVEGASMENTFQTYDYLIVDRLSYRLGAPERGDVVVFHFPLDTSRTFIKRIIGLPGDTVTLSGQKVTIVNTANPKGFTLDEPYVADEHETQSDMTVTVKDGEYFVLGDNRKESADSRYWGMLPKADVIGRAFVRLYPFSQIGLLPGEHRYSASMTTASVL